MFFYAKVLVVSPVFDAVVSRFSRVIAKKFLLLMITVLIAVLFSGVKGFLPIKLAN